MVGAGIFTPPSRAPLVVQAIVLAQKNRACHVMPVLSGDPDVEISVQCKQLLDRFEESPRLRRETHVVAALKLHGAEPAHEIDRVAGINFDSLAGGSPQVAPKI